MRLLTAVASFVLSAAGKLPLYDPLDLLLLHTRQPNASRGLV
jgi:hypothetical protein